MDRKVLQVALLAALPPLWIGFLTWQAYRGALEATVDFEGRNDAGFIAGFYGNRHDRTPGSRWTRRDSYLLLENLPRGDAVRVEARLRAPRPRGVTPPEIWFTADGEIAHRSNGRDQVATYRFRIPESHSRLKLGIHSEAYYQPPFGSLGVELYSVRITSLGTARPARKPIAWMMLTSLVLLAAARAAGLELAAASAFSLLVSTGFTYLLWQDSVRFQAYPQQVATLAFLALLLSIVSSFFLRRITWLPASGKPWLTIALVSGLLLKLSGIFYPLFVSSDGIFQLHRLQEFMGGNWYPTSVTQHQPPFRIPYPISLYLVSAPWVAMGWDGVRVLQVLTSLADVGVGLALAFMTGRLLERPDAAVLVAALYPMVPVTFGALSAGNLSNLFGVSTVVFFLISLLIREGIGTRATAAFVFVSSLLALTSHFSTFLQALILWPAWLGAAGLLGLRGGSVHRRRLLLGAALLSVAVAIVYYTGYLELAGQWQRAWTNEDTKGFRLLDRLAFNYAFWVEEVGIVLGLLAMAGAWSVFRSFAINGAHRALAAWIGATGIFVLLDLTTSVQLRYVLQAAPLIALLAALPLADLARRGRLGRLITGTLLAYLAFQGLQNFQHCVLVRYH